MRINLTSCDKMAGKLQSPPLGLINSSNTRLKIFFRTNEPNVLIYLCVETVFFNNVVVSYSLFYVFT